MINTNKKDYIWSYLAYFLKFGINFFIFPVVLRLLSPYEYGLWVTFSSLGTIVNLFDFGFSSTILRNISYVWSGAQSLQKNGHENIKVEKQKNERLFVITLQTCRKIYLYSSLLAAFIALFIITGYILYIIRDMFRVEYVIAWLLYAINICLNLYFAYWPVALRAVGAIEEAQKATILGFLLQLIISYVGLLHGGGLVALSIAGCLCGTSIRIASIYYFKRYENIGEILVKFKNEIKKSEISHTMKILWFNAKKAGISSIATIVMAQSTTLICSAYYGVEITGMYGLCYQLLTMLVSVSQIYYQTTMPKLTQLRIEGNLKESQKKFSMSVLIGWFLFFIGVGAIILCGNPIFKCMGSQVELNLQLIIIIALYSFGEMNYSMHASYISLDNQLPFVKSVIYTAIVVVIVSLVMAKYSIDFWVLLLMRCICEMFYMFWKWPFEAHKLLQINMLQILHIGYQEIRRVIKMG